MEYSKIVESRKEAYTGELVGEWLKSAYDLGAKDFKQNLSQLMPDIETVSSLVHEAWMKSKIVNGVTSRLSEDGEELMVPYEQLTDKSKDLDRNTVIAVYIAINAAMLTPPIKQDGDKG